MAHTSQCNEQDDDFFHNTVLALKRTVLAVSVLTRPCLCSKMAVFEMEQNKIKVLSHQRLSFRCQLRYRFTLYLILKVSLVVMRMQVGLWCDSTFILCYYILKTVILLHKQGLVKTETATAVIFMVVLDCKTEFAFMLCMNGTGLLCVAWLQFSLLLPPAA